MPAVTLILTTVFKVAIVLFVAGNLLDMGLRLKPQDALRGLRNSRFVGLTLLWGFLAGPAVAFAITRILPLDPAYAAGLLLIGMVPSAPFLPIIAKQAQGDLGYTAAFMLLCAVGTVAFMPVAVPLMIDGLSVSRSTIAAPLFLFMLLPLGIGMAVRRMDASRAERLQPHVKRASGLAAVVVVILCVAIYGPALLSLGGTFAVAAQILFFAVMAALPHRFGFGLPHEQAIVLSTGMATRNLGAAFAPLLAAPDVDQRTLIMVVLGLPFMTGARVVRGTMVRARGSQAPGRTAVALRVACAPH
jgi:BASS family bile acid:Na+ symporter